MTSTAPLFRQSAIQSATGTQIGEALRLHWRGMRIFTATALGFVVLLAGFVATVEYSPVSRIPCYTDARNGLARLSSPITGQVARIAVAEGTEVNQGDLLAVVSSDRLSAAGASQYAALKVQLQSEQAMLEREITAARAEAAASHAMLQRRIAGLQLEQETLRADLQAGEQLLLSLQAQGTAIASIVRQGYATQQQLVQKQDEARAQESRLAASRAAQQRIAREIATSAAERSLIDARLDGVIENRRRATTELERLRVQADLDAEQSIRAPIAGIVSTGLIAPGQSIAAGQPLFTITPRGEPLVVRLVIPARAAASVQPGTQVQVIFSAYPQEKFGAFAARIDSVSDTPSLPVDLQHIFEIKEPSFMAIAALPVPLRSREGRPLRIKPGMLADALVPLERRTVLEWLLEPILRGFNQGAGRVPPSPAEAAQ